MITLSITGMTELENTLDGVRLTLEGGALLNRLIGEATWDIELYAAMITPVVTGRLQEGHSVIGSFRDMTWWVFNEVEYAEYVHAMGGHRAFYDLAVLEYAPERLNRVVYDLAEATGL